MDRRQQKRLLYALSEMSTLEAVCSLLDLFIRTNLNPLYSNLFAVRPTSDQFNEIDHRRFMVLSRIEDFRVFMFMQGVIGMMALVSTFAGNKTPLISGLIASFIFSLAMFMVYMFLIVGLRGVKYFSRRAKQPMS
jgi:hypothetical protein